MSLPKPPYSEETARAVVQRAQDLWNARDPNVIPAEYSADVQWRYKDAFFTGRDGVLPFLEARWPLQQEYRLAKHLWSFAGNRISVRFESEWRHADTGQWYRTHGNEHWEFDDDGLCRVLDISANDIPIEPGERRL